MYKFNKVITNVTVTKIVRSFVFSIIAPIFLQLINNGNRYI
jgi:hypothetical protein